MTSPDTTNLEIVTYQDHLASAFKSLNLIWLEGYHLLEAEDLKYLDHPREMILNRGGQIYFAVRSTEAVGTCAVVPRSKNNWELLKLAVHPAEQGRGLGRRLTLAALAFAHAHGARKVVLVSSTKLGPALRLYESIGFRHAAMLTPPPYATADVYMELEC